MGAKNSHHALDGMSNDMIDLFFLKAGKAREVKPNERLIHEGEVVRKGMASRARGETDAEFQRTLVAACSTAQQSAPARLGGAGVLRGAGGGAARRGWETCSRQPTSESGAKAATPAAWSQPASGAPAAKPPSAAGVADDTARSAANATGRAFNAWAGAVPPEGAAIELGTNSFPSLESSPRSSKDLDVPADAAAATTAPAAGPSPRLESRC